jgi:acyl-CoA dehydrogenase
LDAHEPIAHHRVMSETEVSAEDFALIHQQVRSFIRSEVVPREVEIMQGDRIPDDLRAMAADMGLFGYAIPAEWGGLGLDLTQDVELAMEFGYTTLSLRSMFGTNNGIAGQVLVGFGTDAQKQLWLERIATGEVIASFALTEPGAGSNPAGLRTRARSSSSPTRRSRVFSSSSRAPPNPSRATRGSRCSSSRRARPA